MQPFNQSIAITYRALIALVCGTRRIAARALEAYQQAIECRAPYYSAWSNILVRFGETMQQPDTSNLARLRAALEGFTKTGARVRLPLYFCLLTRACHRAGQIEPAQEALEKAFLASEQNNEHWWDAELHRLQGELWLARGMEADKVEACFFRSLEVARAQKARSLELRAATSLARLRQKQGNHAEVYNLLSPIYACFTEGFDTPDLKAARALLDQLES